MSIKMYAKYGKMFSTKRMRANFDPNTINISKLCGKVNNILSTCDANL